MYVEIHSVDADKSDESSGKTSWVNRSEYKVFLRGGDAQHLGFPPWYLEIIASAEYESGTGELGGFVKAVRRRADIQLAPNDIDVLLKFLVENQLINVDQISVSKNSKKPKKVK